MARGAPVHSQGYVLNRTKLRETDAILTLLLQDGSLVRCVAKGARRPGSRFAGLSELYAFIELLLAPGRSLYTLSDAKLIDSFRAQEESLEALAGAAAFSETLLKAFPEGEQAPFLFGLSQAAFLALKQCVSLPSCLLVSAAATLKLLSYLGWKPELCLCVECGSKMIDWVSVSAGGGLCAQCGPHTPDAQPVDSRALAWLQALLARRLIELAQAPIDEEMARLLALFVKSWAAYHLDTYLKAFNFLLSL